MFAFLKDLNVFQSLSYLWARKTNLCGGLSVEAVVIVFSLKLFVHVCLCVNEEHIYITSEYRARRLVVNEEFLYHLKIESWASWCK